MALTQDYIDGAIEMANKLQEMMDQSKPSFMVEAKVYQLIGYIRALKYIRPERES